MMFCGLKIYTMLKQNGRSRKTRSLQRKIFFMLLVQTCCPIVFLQTPSFFNIVSTATGFQQPNYLPFPLALLLQFYATSHFLSTILFIKDYRRYFISCFRKTVGRYRSASSIGTSELNVMSKGAADFLPPKIRSDIIRAAPLGPTMIQVDQIRYVKLQLSSFRAIFSMSIHFSSNDYFCGNSESECFRRHLTISSFFQYREHVFVHIRHMREF
ncbi:unnamed protein product, partial [Mesorhabditis belari]|uniref:G protein-coupled receptor n=1 Tax=Mesorhabditis belari TaxID=2138241 RepID=A0AAF3J1B7_9BILA